MPKVRGVMRACDHRRRIALLLSRRQATARAGACDVFSIYNRQSCGIGPARPIADFALCNGIACTIGSTLELRRLRGMIHLGLAHHGITGRLSMRTYRRCFTRMTF